MNQDEARAALAAMQEAKDRLAESQSCPPWRHAAFGVLMAAINGMIAVPMPGKAVIAVAAAAFGFWLYRSDRRRSGTFVNGYRRGRTLPMTLGLLGALLALLFAQVHAHTAGLSVLTKVVIAGLACILATWASVVWQRVYQAELRGGDQ